MMMCVENVHPFGGFHTPPGELEEQMMTAQALSNLTSLSSLELLG